MEKQLRAAVDLRTKEPGICYLCSSLNGKDKDVFAFTPYNSEGELRTKDEVFLPRHLLKFL